MPKEQTFSNGNQNAKRRAFETFQIDINMHQNRFQLVKKRNFQNSGSPDSFKCVGCIGIKLMWLLFKPQLTLKFIWFEWKTNETNDQVTVAYAERKLSIHRIRLYRIH